MHQFIQHYILPAYLDTISKRWDTQPITIKWDKLAQMRGLYYSTILCEKNMCLIYAILCKKYMINHTINLYD